MTTAWRRGRFQSGLWTEACLWSWLVAALATVHSVGAAQAQEPDPFGGQAAKRFVEAKVTERNQAAETALDSLEIDFPFAEARPLKEVLSELHVATGLKFVVDASAVDCDLNAGTEITFAAESLRLRTGLDLMLETFSCTYLIRDGLVLIISQDAACDPRNFRLKSFDVEELLQLLIRAEKLEDDVRAEPNSPKHDGFGAAGNHGGGRGGLGGGSGQAAGGGMFSTGTAQEGSEQPNKAEVAPTPDAPQIAKQAEGSPSPVRMVRYSAKQQAQAKLIDFLQRNVAPDEWSETGQGDGTIEVLGGVLVVGQSESILHSVGAALDDLERKLRAIEARQAK